MLRQETQSGYYLITHPDHANLAVNFARHWGNKMFPKPEPYANVMKGIARHDDGWLQRDANPQITKQKKPSAFGTELVGKYSAFEEIDLTDYLAVRDNAVRKIAQQDPYAALLIALHTYNLLTEHADRTTIAPDQLPLLDNFLPDQKIFQNTLKEKIDEDRMIPAEQKSETAIQDNFHLLQATDNLSLLTCVDFRQPSHLLHALPQTNGTRTTIAVHSIAERHFILNPYPFNETTLTFQFPARHLPAKLFDSHQSLQQAYTAAPVELLTVTLSA
jgi:hypothetical protein